MFSSEIVYAAETRVARLPVHQCNLYSTTVYAVWPLCLWRDDSTLTLYRDLFRLLDGVDRLKGEWRILVAIAAEEFVLEFDPLQAERM